MSVYAYLKSLLDHSSQYLIDISYLRKYCTLQNISMTTTKTEVLDNIYLMKQNVQ